MKSNTIVQRHYGLRRRVTDEEVKAEIESLRRKDERETLCDFAFRLFIALGLDRKETE